MLSSPPVPVLTIRLPATPDRVRDARAAVGRFAAMHGASDGVGHRVELAVGEAVANVIVHAYANLGAAGSVEVAADIEQGDLEVVVADAGLGFRSGPAPGAGLGLLIVERCADAFAIRERADGGVEVWLRFHLGA